MGSKQIKVRTKWLPASGETWHRFTITTFPDHVRIAYDRCDAGGCQVAPAPYAGLASVDDLVEWELAPTEIRAWRDQRAHGYDGTAYSLPDAWPVATA